MEAIRSPSLREKNRLQWPIMILDPLWTAMPEVVRITYLAQQLRRSEADSSSKFVVHNDSELNK